MKLRDTDWSPLFLMKCRLVIRSFVSILCVFSNIWFCIDGNTRTIRKKPKRTQIKGKIEALERWWGGFIGPAISPTSVEESGGIYHNREKHDVLEDLRVIWKEEKRVNKIDQWCIALFHGYFEGMKFYTVEQWVKVIPEGLDNAYFPINISSTKNPNNNKIPL